MGMASTWMVNRLSAWVRDRLEVLSRRGQEGQTTVEWMAIATLATVALVGIFALVRAFGAEVMDFIGEQLGV